MAYNRFEQETCIVWDEGGKMASIYTASPVSIRKLERLCENYPQEYRRTSVELDLDGGIAAAEYEVGCKFIRFGKPASEARREHGRKLAAMRAEMQNTAE